ncbi:MAG: M24 family metallopeptidase [Chloroflexi bacterium]|nr:M24 family metallopeptidase [Chloroflexota bacterium]
MLPSPIDQAQEYLRRHRLPAWLLYDYRGMNPVFWAVVGPVSHVTRPCWFLIPARGEPRLLVHHVDAGRFAPLGLPMTVFTSRRGMVASLKGLARGFKTVAMEYSPLGELPRASRVDAGTVELVRSLGLRIVSSADLFQYATQRWTPAQLASHRSAARKLSRIVMEAFQHITERLTSGVTEWEVARFIRARYEEEGLTASEGPTVAVNAHASDPHFEPSPGITRPIQRGDWVLLDIWAREEGPAAIYADITWVGYVGSRMPEAHQRVFQAVVGARDAAVEYIQEANRQGRALRGWQVDRVARRFIREAGYGRFFTHRLGHSLGYQVHGDAVNLDSWETRDTRTLLPGLGVTIEPGIYLPELGMRSEIDVYLSVEGPEVTTAVQHEVVLLG